MPLFYQLRERFLIERVLPVLTADDVVDATAMGKWLDGSWV